MKLSLHYLGFAGKQIQAQLGIADWDAHMTSV